MFDTIEEVESYMLSIPKFRTVGRSAANFNLDRMKDFCEKMGNPQERVPMIHVAGTNGKGTTCQMLASVYQEAGYRVGLYTSPHLVDVRERFRINGEWITDPYLLEFFQEYEDFILSRKVTFFELTTAIAFWYFERQNVDLAVIETGLGGRLDATNVIDPLISVITSVGMDHTDILGDSIAKIAEEKAGIIKNKRPVVVGRLDKEAISVINDIAEKKGANVHDATELNPEYENDNFILYVESGKVIINAKGRKQIDAINVAVSWEVKELLQAEFEVSEASFIAGIEKMDSRIGYHAHFYKIHPVNNWYFDGAHNVESVIELIKELKRIASPQKWRVILSFMDDKLRPEISNLWNEFPNLMIYQQEGDRAASVEKMKSYFPNAEVVTSEQAIQYFGAEDKKTELVIFSGSFYFYKTVRNWMGTEAYNHT
jgi:dihydrofolate synthase / folylpolyglutamate synthase